MAINQDSGSGVLLEEAMGVYPAGGACKISGRGYGPGKSMAGKCYTA